MKKKKETPNNKTEKGWVKTEETFAGCEIWKRGKERMLYDASEGKIAFTYWDD